MQRRTVHIVSQAIRYIEEHLHEKIDLDMVALALHYSKYHLHRIFTKAVGLTIHDYAKRRQLTEAAKLLVFSEKPIIELALMSGYESQQAFTDIFKGMYKTSPGEFREMENFYPLQLEIHLKEEHVKMDLTKDSIRFATLADVDDWMEYFFHLLYLPHCPMGKYLQPYRFLGHLDLLWHSFWYCRDF